MVWINRVFCYYFSLLNQWNYNLVALLTWILQIGVDGYLIANIVQNFWHETVGQIEVRHWTVCGGYKFVSVPKKDLICLGFLDDDLTFVVVGSHVGVMLLNGVLLELTIVMEASVAAFFFAFISSDVCKKIKSLSIEPMIARLEKRWSYSEHSDEAVKDGNCRWRHQRIRGRSHPNCSDRSSSVDSLTDACPCASAVASFSQTTWDTHYKSAAVRRPSRGRR